MAQDRWYVTLVREEDKNFLRAYKAQSDDRIEIPLLDIQIINLMKEFAVYVWQYFNIKPIPSK